MNRVAEWDLRLIEYATAVKGMPFVWGNTNCAALAAGSVDAMTGTDLFGFQKGLDLDERKAREFSKQHYTRETLLNAGLVIVEEEGYGCIQRGDIILAFSDGWECSHICLGKYVLTSTPDRGVFFGRLSDLLNAGEPMEVLRCPQ